MTVIHVSIWRRLGFSIDFLLNHWFFLPRQLSFYKNLKGQETMGLFGKKKKDDISWDDIQSQMQAPKIPTELPDWFEANKRSLVDTGILKSSGAVIPSSWINVETASISISNFIPLPCDECEDRESCRSCVRGGTNSIFVSTANADGDYLVWEMYNSPESFNKHMADGFLVFFDQSVYPTIKADTPFAFKSQDLAPVFLGEVQVKNHVNNSGMLHFMDALASIDSDFFIAGARAKSTSFNVVAWIGYTNMGSLAPMAITVTSDSYADVFAADTRVTAPIPIDLRETAFNAGEVLARMGNNQEHYAQINGDYYSDPSSRLVFLSVSWILQNMVHGNPDETMQHILSEGASNALAAIDGLRIRGQMTYSMKALVEVEKKFASELTSRERLLIDLIRKTPAGQFIIEP